MFISTIGEFPIYVFSPDEEVPEDLDPMSYQVLMKVSEEKHVYRAFCQNIPCDFCVLKDHGCVPGKEQTSIVNHIKQAIPELYI